MSVSAEKPGAMAIRPFHVDIPQAELDELRVLDSPLALAAWMLDHDTDSYSKISRAFLDGQPAGQLTRDRIVDNITLYGLTGTGASAARS
jgi:hypothetical protein